MLLLRTAIPAALLSFNVALRNVTKPCPFEDDGRKEDRLSAHLACPAMHVW